MTISNATLFKQAHAMARATIQDGDDYRTTFGACLKAIKDELKQAANIDLFVIIAAIIAMVTAKFSVINGDVIYRNNASLITTYHTSKLLGAFKWCVIFSPIIIAMLALFAATAEAEAIELPSQKGAIVYANKDGKKVAFEVTTVNANGFIAKDLYSRKITIFKLSDNKLTSSNGYNYDEQASKDWLDMYNSEQKRLNK